MNTPGLFRKDRSIICLVSTLLVVVSTGCGSISVTPVLPTIEPITYITVTSAPTKTRIIPSDTPLPTETPTPIPTKTPEPSATLDLQATDAFQATEASSVVLAKVKKDLTPYKISLPPGNLVYVQSEPNELSLSSYGEARFDPFNDNLNVGDFILKTDVTWDSKTGLAGCGLFFHTEQDYKEGERFVFNTLRLSGYPGWDVEFHKQDQIVDVLTGETQVSNKIKIESGSTNTYILMVKGSTITLYANNYRIGGVEGTQRDSGYFAYFAWQESGQTTCTFSNTWVWEMNKE